MSKNYKEVGVSSVNESLMKRAVISGKSFESVPSTPQPGEI